MDELAGKRTAGDLLPATWRRVVVQSGTGVRGGVEGGRRSWEICPACVKAVTAFLDMVQQSEAPEQSEPEKTPKLVEAARKAAAEQSERKRLRGVAQAKAARQALENLAPVRLGALVQRDGMVTHVVPVGDVCREHSGVVRSELRCDAR